MDAPSPVGEDDVAKTRFELAECQTPNASRCRHDADALKKLATNKSDDLP